MEERVAKVLKIWHEYFRDENAHYSEFESSDIEYFVGCLLYNHFAFSKALDTMKTIDLSYDFIASCGDEYDEVLAIIKSIEFENERQKLVFLQDYIRESKEKYSADALYLLNRLGYHVDGMAQRYKTGEEAQKVDFQKITTTQNPLTR